MSRNPPHDSTLDRLEDLIRALLPAGWRLRGQKGVALATGQPEPDVAVVLGPAARYDDHHPGPGEIALVAEVSETTLPVDRGPKMRAYSRAGIPVYWIVNLVDRQVEVYTDPVTPPGGERNPMASAAGSSGETSPPAARPKATLPDTDTIGPSPDDTLFPPEPAIRP